jgi:hypothetical protein
VFEIGFKETKEFDLMVINTKEQVQQNNNKDKKQIYFV